MEKAEAFALWRLPREANATLIVQYSKPNHQWISGSDGFIFHPFVPSENCPVVFIKAEEKISIESRLIPEIKETISANFFPDSTTQQFAGKLNYMQYVQQSIDAIKDGQLSKTVAARAFHSEAKHPVSMLMLFKKLCENYPQAFVSLVYSRQSGVWCGATPELLLKNSNGKLQTMALAGTVSVDENREWSEKEKQEQQFVRTFIKEAFEELKIIPRISQTQELKAGNSLKHLVNYFEAQLPADDNFNQFQSLIKALHPTPAVAGLPKQKAVDWILTREPLHRLYYSGYLGPVHSDNSFELFVNLRCMQWLEQEIILYAGAGITSDSNPESEWEETQRKMQTIGSVIHNLPS
ncbi:MAG: isochorismate synthase [Bacteroidia bacterium]|nr:isochorismate synthase [Bacteroidia bacterium]